MTILLTLAALVALVFVARTINVAHLRRAERRRQLLERWRINAEHQGDAIIPPVSALGEDPAHCYHCYLTALGAARRFGHTRAEMDEDVQRIEDQALAAGVPWVRRIGAATAYSAPAGERTPPPSLRARRPYSI